MIKYLEDIRPLIRGSDVREDHHKSLVRLAVPGCLDMYGNPLYAGTWVIHSMSSGGIQLTRIEAIEAPVRPDVMDAIIKVRTPRRTWDQAALQYRQGTLGPVRQVAQYGVVRYFGKLPDEYHHLA